VSRWSRHDGNLPRRAGSQRIRHIPVVDDGKLVGIVSMRDLLAIENMGVT